LALNLDRLEGRDFEDLIERLLLKMGFQTQGRKRAADGGIDIVAVSSLPLLGGRYIIQCKRYANSVSSPIVRDLYGVVSAEKANKGILITTSSFTTDAVEFAKDKQLELIDRAKLLKLLQEHSLFISPDEKYNPMYLAATMLRNEFAGQVDLFEKSMADIDSRLGLTGAKTFGSNNDQSTYLGYNNFLDYINGKVKQSSNAMTQIAAKLNSFLYSQDPDPAFAATIGTNCRELLKFLLAAYQEIKTSTPPDLFTKTHEIMTNVFRTYLTDIAEIIRGLETFLQKGGDAPRFALNLKGIPRYTSARDEAWSLVLKKFGRK